MTSPEHLKKLAAYVPTPVTQALYRHPQALTEPAGRRFPAVVLFTDISGFTYLSELFGRAGPTGAEELTQYINQYFSRMIEIVEAHRGQVVKFSGDALIVLFPAEATPMGVAVRRAGECALAMQATMSDFANLRTSRGQASLSMKVGIGAGQVIACNVGGVLGRWEYVVGGDPLAQVAMAEHRAQPGQIILSPQAWELAQEFFTGTANEQADNFVNLHQVITPLAELEPIILDWTRLDTEQRQLVEKSLECYVPGAIKARLGEQADWLAELRRMTILFIGVGGIDYEAADASKKLQNFLEATQEIIYRFEGSLGKVAVDDKGTVFLVLFGAPPFSHEDDATRAVTFALHLQTIAREQSLRVSIGITEGPVFAGPVGAPDRREYTVIGDEVNSAARLMQYGRAGTILISDRVKERAGSRFVTESLGQISLRGKAETLGAHLVKGEQGTQEEFMMRYLSHEQPLVNRKPELEEFRQVAARAQAGTLQLLFIEGDLGLGKSRLVSEIVREWMMKGGAGYGSKCISYGRQIPYQAWREVLTAIYGMTPNLSPERQLARLANGIAELKDPPGQSGYWAIRIPLLADVLGLDVPDNDFTRNISAQLRRNNTFALIKALLEHQAERWPLLIVLEDIHWADELSLSLVNYLAQSLTDISLMLVLVYRPNVEVDFNALTDIKNFRNSHTISLDPFSREESIEFIKTLLADRRLPSNVEETLLSWGQGNPFFLQEIAGSILEVIEAQTDPSFEPVRLLDLPDSVHDVIFTRVDRLSEAEKLTLKVASVIGTSFQRSLLSAVHPMRQTRYVFQSHLETLENAKLIQLEAPAPKWEYIFRNVITQEVVYEGLLLAQRRQLHAAVGQALEFLVPDEVERLAFHFNRSDNIEKALHYLDKAAEKAYREYANHTAIDYYSEILILLKNNSFQSGRGGRLSSEYWDALSKRAKLYNLIGQREKELEDLGTLGIIAEVLNDDRRRAMAAKQWAHFYETGGDYDSGLELIERSVHLAQLTGDEKLLVEAYNQWGKLLYLHREYETAEKYLQIALNIAQKRQDEGAQADCFSSLGVVAYYHAYEDPTYYDVVLYFQREAIELWQALGDQVGLAGSLSNQGLVYYDIGQYTAAQQCYQQALALHQTIGDRAGEAAAKLGLGRIQRSLGNYVAARTLLEEALTIYQTVGDRRGEAQSLCHLGFVHCRLTDHDSALIFLNEALSILRGHEEPGPHRPFDSPAEAEEDMLFQRELDDIWTLGKSLTYYGWTLLNNKQLDEAKAYLEEAVKIKRGTQQNVAAVEDMAHLGRVAMALNQPDLADTYARHALEHIKTYGVQGIEHPAMVYLTCYHISQANQKFEQAKTLFSQGKQYVTLQAAQIDDPALRKSFLSNIPENQEIQELARDADE